MIFLTVGEQLPFDRLISSVDELAPKYDLKIFGQIGSTGLVPKNMEYANFLSPEEYKERFLEADVIIAHAGMGTILSALEYKKPLIIMPRDASLKEHRNDHQFATANKFQNIINVTVVKSRKELESELKSIDKLIDLAKETVTNVAPLGLINKIRCFLLEDIKH